MFLDLHHHIRNNLAIILGFIEMKKVGKDAQDTKLVLDDLGDKIYAIACTGT